MASSSRIDELRKKFDENPRRYFAPLANEYRKIGDVDQAIFICQEYLPQQPGHMSGHIVYGQALYEAARMDEARSVFETALNLDPENLIALRHLGDIANGKGEASAARAWYQRVLEADPRNEEIAALLSSLLTRPSEPTPAPAITDQRVTAEVAVVPEPFAPPSPASIDEAVVIERTSEASGSVAEVAASLADAADEHALFDISEFNIGGEIFPASAPPPPVTEAGVPATPSEGEPHVEPVITAEAELAAAAAEAAFEADSLAITGFHDDAFTSDPFASVADPDSIPNTDDIVAAVPEQPLAGVAEASVLGEAREEESPPAVEPPAVPEYHEAPSQHFAAGVSDDESVGAHVSGAVEAAEALEAPLLADAGAPEGVVAGPPVEEREAPSEPEPLPEPETAFVTETMAQLYLEQGHRAEAIEIYRQLVERRPDDAALHDRLATLELPPEEPVAPPVEESTRDRGPAIRQRLRELLFDWNGATPVATPAVPAPDASVVGALDLADHSAETSGVEDESPTAGLPEVERREDVDAGISSPRESEEFAVDGMRDDSILPQEALPADQPYRAAPTPIISERAEEPTATPAVVSTGEPQGSIDALFPGAVATAANASAATVLSDAFRAGDGRRDTPLRGMPAHRATGELSLEHVFRTEPRTPSAPPSTEGASGFALEQFFAGGVAGAEAQRPSVEEPGAGLADVEQFNRWLQGLRKT